MTPHGWRAALALAGIATIAAAPLPPLIAQMATSGSANLTLLDAQLQQKSMAWVAWDDGADADRAVHLALVVRGSGAKIWTHDWPESYSPTITLLPNWHFLGNPMIALTYQQGAAAESFALFGVGKNGAPVSLGERDAAAIEVYAADKGEISVSYGPGSSPQRECLSWHEAKAQLVAHACRKAVTIQSSQG